MTSSGSKLSIASRDTGDVTVVVLAGEMLLDDGDLAFRREIQALLARQRRKIVVDLGGVTYIDSAGMGMIVSKRRAVVEAGGDLKLLKVSSRNQRVLALMKLSSIFEMFEDEDAAVRSFQ